MVINVIWLRVIMQTAGNVMSLGKATFTVLNVLLGITGM